MVGCRWFVLMVVVVFAFELKAEGELGEDNLITIKGTVHCIDPINGTLESVSIININKEWGTITGTKGEFEIRMGLSDTIIFFTEAHQDYYYFLDEKQEFVDHNVSVFMEPDAIWMQTIEIIGISNLEEFKMEVLKMKIPQDEYSVIDPDLNKYAKEQVTGKPMPVLIGPLTYLSEKFLKQHRIIQRAKMPALGKAKK